MSSTPYTVETVETVQRVRFGSAVTVTTYHVVDTEDHHREIAVFPAHMKRDAEDLAADLNLGEPEPTDPAGVAQWRDYREPDVYHAI